ncbi:basic helix-loop-helix protein A [Nymphaea thermarum]|nr:basic helix-loop-helix protein A [Nymphaea thermarum]
MATAGQEPDPDSPGARLQRQLQAVVQSVRWTYSIFWQVCPLQGVLLWCDGHYNGATKTRKTVQPMEVSTEEACSRSQQLRELYHSLNAALSPEDLTESEWFYLMCISFSFSPGVGTPLFANFLLRGPLEGSNTNNFGPLEERGGKKGGREGGRRKKGRKEEGGKKKGRREEEEEGKNGTALPLQGIDDVPAADALHASPTSQSSDRRLRDALDVVPQNLPATIPGGVLLLFSPKPLPSSQRRREGWARLGHGPTLTNEKRNLS